MPDPRTAFGQISRTTLGPPRTAESYRPSWAGRIGPNDRMKSAWYIGMTAELGTSITLFRTRPRSPTCSPCRASAAPTPHAAAPCTH